MLILKKLEQDQHHNKGLILDPQKYHFLYQQQQQNQENNQEKQELGFHGFHHHQLQQQNQETPFLNQVGVTSPAGKKRAGEEYAPEKMAESYQYHNQQQQQPTGSSRLGLRTTGGGEIVEVQGGHIVRSTGRKDRHSKVCTAKGPRDRRVRLSAHTAIQFYDVQDRLGYDRPSKAVDWLIKKAKTAIDELAELPAWKPTATAVVSRNPNLNSVHDFEQNPDQLGQFEQHPDVQNSSFLPPSLDSDSIADTIKSFFPMGAASNAANNDTSSSGMQFHQNSRTQDLRLSLQSFQDPILQTEQGHNGNNNNGNIGNNNHNSNNIYFDGSSWPDNQSNGFQRMVTWGGDVNSTGFVFSSPQAPVAPAPAFLFGQTTNNQLFNNNSQRGPLQSSTAPSFRAWIDPPPPQFGGGGGMDQHPTLAFHHPSSIPGYGYASSLNGFSGFRIPARIQGEEEEHDGISDKPSSASSDSRH